MDSDEREWQSVGTRWFHIPLAAWPEPMSSASLSIPGVCNYRLNCDHTCGLSLDIHPTVCPPCVRRVPESLEPCGGTPYYPLYLLRYNDDDDYDDIYNDDALPYQPMTYYWEPCNRKLQCGHECVELIPIPRQAGCERRSRLNRIDDFVCPPFEKCSHICQSCKPDAGTGAGLPLPPTSNYDGPFTETLTMFQRDRGGKSSNQDLTVPSRSFPPPKSCLQFWRVPGLMSCCSP